MIAAIAAAEADASIRAILTGAGGTFTSGNDIKDFAMAAAAGEGPRVAIDFLEAISTARKPIVAAVEGFAVGIGTTMLFALRPRLRRPLGDLPPAFVTLGLLPEGRSSYLLPLVAGSKKAAELLMLGEAFNAETAAEPPGQRRRLERHGAGSRSRQGEGACRAAAGIARPDQDAAEAWLGPAVAETIATEARHFGERLKSPEAMAAFMAFLKK